MANENKSLWPDFEANSIITPKAILLEQGKFLSEKTKNILETDVRSSSLENNVYLHFYIVAPNMNNYSFHLLTLIHDVQLYPSTIKSYHDKTPVEYSCKNQKEVLSALKEIFNHSSSIKIIQSLLAQSI